MTGKNKMRTFEHFDREDAYSVCTVCRKHSAPPYNIVQMAGV
jgi:hypothetical protein